MKAPHTIDTNTLETVSGGWRHHGWHRGYRGATVVNNYWGGAQPVAQAAPQANFSMQMSSSWG
jgi:hypothetical protein